MKRTRDPGRCAVSGLAWVKALARRLVGTWTGPSDDVFTPAGWDLTPGDEQEDEPAPELRTISELLRDCGAEMRSGCRCNHCDHIRTLLWAVYGHADLTDTDHALLEQAGLAWEPEAPQ